MYHFFAFIFINKFDFKNVVIIILGPILLIILIERAGLLHNKFKFIMKDKNGGRLENQSKPSIKQEGTSESKDNSKNIKIQFIVILFLILVLFQSYLIIYYIVGMIGNSFGNQMKLNNPSNITYYTTNGHDSVQGIIVEQTGNTYFISTYPDRELIIISTPYIIAEPLK